MKYLHISRQLKVHICVILAVPPTTTRPSKISAVVVSKQYGIDAQWGRVRWPYVSIPMEAQKSDELLGEALFYAMNLNQSH